MYLKIKRSAQRFSKVFLILQFLNMGMLQANEVATPADFDLDFSVDGLYLLKNDQDDGSKYTEGVLQMRAAKVDGKILGTRFGGAITGLIFNPGVIKESLQGSGFCSLWSSRCEFKLNLAMKQADGSIQKIIYELKLENEYYDMAFYKDPEIAEVEMLGKVYSLEGEFLGSFHAYRLNHLNNLVQLHKLE